MKYIRTKDNSIKKVYADRGNIIECENGRNLICIDKKDIIKQADTIEELCDEFVRVSKSVHDFLVSDDIPTKKFADTEVYGAIWTDKGLIYVAKMNEKEELELL